MTRRPHPKVKILSVRQADEQHGNVTFSAPRRHLTHRPGRQTPCVQCPWRRENVGAFPAQAFVHSANTGYDASLHTFACHMSGLGTPQVCAGFLLRNAENNLAVRLQRMDGHHLDCATGGADLYGSYREMAMANGVPEDHPALAPLRANDE